MFRLANVKAGQIFYEKEMNVIFLLKMDALIYFTVSKINILIKFR